MNKLITRRVSRRDVIQVAVAGGMQLVLGLGDSVRAQTTAMEQLRILCSGPAGSIPDIVARRVAEQLAKSYPQGVVVDNRPGAAGQTAINALKSVPADGSTVLLAQGAVTTVYPYLYAKLAYDPVVDLQPVSLAAEMTLGLAVGPAVPDSVMNVQDFVDWMRRNPTLANVGSPGTGTLPHLLEVLLFQQAGVAWQHRVYAGGPPSMVDLLGGHIAALVLPEGLLRQHRNTGRLRVLATSAAQRSHYLPEVASLAEQGYHDLVMREWFAFFTAAQVTGAAIDTLSSTLRQAITRPEFGAALAESGMVAAASTPAALAHRIAAEQRYWEPVLRAASLRSDS